MIYSNVKTEVKSKDLGCGVKYYIGIADTHRPIALWTEENLALEEGMNEKITAGINRRRVPCLLPQEDLTLYLFLYAATDKLGVKTGEIKIYKDHAENVRVIRHFGEDKCLLAEVVNPLRVTFIEVRPYGLTENEPADIYVVHKCEVYHCTSATLKACCEQNGIDEFDDLCSRGCAPAATDWVKL